MKHLMLLSLCITIACTGCKKEEKSIPAPAVATTPSSTMTATETSLVGKWYWDKTENWSGGALVATYDHATHPGQASAYMELKTSKYMGLTVVNPPQLYDNVWFISGTPSLFPWDVKPAGVFPLDFLDTDSPPFSSSGGYINSVSSTTLILTDWSGSIPNGMKNFYHK